MQCSAFFRSAAGPRLVLRATAVARVIGVHLIGSIVTGGFECRIVRVLRVRSLVVWRGGVGFRHFGGTCAGGGTAVLDLIFSCLERCCSPLRRLSFKRRMVARFSCIRQPYLTRLSFASMKLAI